MIMHYIELREEGSDIIEISTSDNNCILNLPNSSLDTGTFASS